MAEFKQEPPQGGTVLTFSPYWTHLSDLLLQYQIHFVAKTKLVSTVTDEGVEIRRIGLQLQTIIWKLMFLFPIEKLKGKSLKLTKYHPDVYSSITNNSQTTERARVSINWWVDTDIVYLCIYIYKYTMEYYSAIKTNEISPFATTWIVPECIMLSKISQSEKDKHYMILLICEI